MPSMLDRSLLRIHTGFFCAYSLDIVSFLSPLFQFIPYPVLPFPVLAVLTLAMADPAHAYAVTGVLGGLAAGAGHSFLPLAGLARHLDHMLNIISLNTDGLCLWPKLIPTLNYQ